MSRMNVSDVAEDLRLSEWTIRQKARSGAIRASLVGGHWLFDREDVDDYVDGCANRPSTRRRRRAS